MHVTILALTLNERVGVEAILPQIKPGWYDQLIVVDGGSTDGTVEWCHEHGYEVYEQKQKGIRYAYSEVMPLVNGDIVLTLSPDGNCDVSEIPTLLSFMNYYADLEWNDLVIGSRYKGTTSQDDDPITAFGNWVFTKVIGLFFGYPYTDAMVIYRAFRKDLYYELDLDKDESYRLYEWIFGTTVSIEPLMSIRAAKAKKRIMEIGVGEPKRIGGERKLQIFRWGGAYMVQVWRELWNWKP